MAIMDIPGKAFDVHGSLPKGTKGNDMSYSKQVHFLVLASELGEALALVVDAYPDMQIDNIKHIGSRNIIAKAVD